MDASVHTTWAFESHRVSRILWVWRPLTFISKERHPRFLWNGEGSVGIPLGLTCCLQLMGKGSAAAVLQAKEAHNYVLACLHPPLSALTASCAAILALELQQILNTDVCVCVCVCVFVCVCVCVWGRAWPVDAVRLMLMYINVCTCSRECFINSIYT